MRNERKSTVVPAAHPHMRRAERELNVCETEEILRRGTFGILCTCGESGEPYGVPICYVYDERCICFHCATEGHKVCHLLQNPQVCFTVVGQTECLPSRFSMLYESAVVFGRVRLAGYERKRAILRTLVEKYSPDFLEKGESYISHDADKTDVWELQITRMSGKAHR